MHLVWNFFATSHGKSACDGIGGTTKDWLLMQAYRDQIMIKFSHQLTSTDSAKMRYMEFLSFMCQRKR